MFHVPGRIVAAGERSRAGFAAFIGKVMARSGGTFREEVRDVLANDQHGVALLFHSLQRDGRAIEYRTVHVWRIRNGKLAEWWEHPHETTTFDEAWSRGRARLPGRGRLCYNLAFPTGRSAAWLARSVRDAEVPSSNLGAPTLFPPPAATATRARAGANGPEPFVRL